MNTMTLLQYLASREPLTIDEAIAQLQFSDTGHTALCKFHDFMGDIGVSLDRENLHALRSLMLRFEVDPNAKSDFFEKAYEAGAKKGTKKYKKHP